MILKEIEEVVEKKPMVSVVSPMVHEIPSLEDIRLEQLKIQSLVQLSRSWRNGTVMGQKYRLLVIPFYPSP